MKGLSPIIAIVLIIGFTVAVAAVVSIWLITLTKTQTSVIGEQTEKQVKCIGSSLIIKEVKYNSTATGTCSVNVTVAYETGTEILANMTVEISAKGTTVRSTSTASVSLGESKSFTNSSAICPPEYVRAIAICQETVPVVGECRSGEPCMKPV